MRLCEIENSKEEIIKLLGRYFDYDGTPSIVNGLVELFSTCKLDRNVDKLPVKFGHVMGHFLCQGRGLQTLEGSPTTVINFIATLNELTSLAGAPTRVTGSFLVARNPLVSLDGLPEFIGKEIRLSYDENLPLLKLLFVNGLKEVNFEPFDNNSNLIRPLLNKYLGQGQGGALACAAELNRAGFRRNARR